MIAEDVPVIGKRKRPTIAFKGLGKPFLIFIGIVGLFELGNSSDAFLVLRAQDLGVSVAGILLMLVIFNLVYSVVSTPAGALSDHVGRRRVIIGGWLAYAVIHLGFAVAQTGWQVWLLYTAYGLYYGLSYGTTKAIVADLVPVELRGTGYGTFNAILGLLDFPASLIAGILWQALGPSTPFFFGAFLALIAALLMAIWHPPRTSSTI